MTEPGMVEKVAWAIAAENSDSFDDAPAGKAEWTAKRGEFGGRFRDINEPYRSDYLDMARAAIEAMREPTQRMLAAAWGKNRKEAWAAMLDAALKGDGQG